MIIEGNIVDIQTRCIYPGIVIVEGRKIASIQPVSNKHYNEYILPGFVDSHVHIESSMLVPSEFAKMAVVHGTVATVSDPHEIANVCGMEGVQYMIANGKTVPFKFNFGAPGCVPATVYETAGAVISVDDIIALLAMPEIKYLAEMMNFPGVLQGQAEVMQKIDAAVKANKPIDGHAPGLRGDMAKRYIHACRDTHVVISTDHECFTYDEALDKLQAGMKILIREGSAAKNFEALIGLLRQYPDRIMFCSDDKHPDSLLLAHINQLCARAVAKGINVFDVLQAACINPVQHYNLDVGLLQPGDAADFVVVKNLEHFEVLKTFINGEKVAENGVSLIKTNKAALINNFNTTKKLPVDFAAPYNNEAMIPVIEALDGQLITNKIEVIPKVVNGFILTDIENDILKIAVVNRYANAPVAIGFIKNFGLKAGALASSVAHDSHNIVVVGVEDESICRAVNLVIEHKGGISCAGYTVTKEQQTEMVLPLPVGGIMSNEDGYRVAEAYTSIDAFAKKMGCSLQSPFMTLSFMALLVIPELKMSDKGMFDGKKFEFI